MLECTMFEKKEDAMKKLFVLLLACFMLLGMNTPLDVFASTSKVWSYVDAPEDMIEGTTGTWSGIAIDATAIGAKFNKRVDNQDIQINAQTKLIIPVESHQEGAEITLQLSGGEATVSVLENEYKSASQFITIPLSSKQTEQDVTVEFKTTAYLLNLSLSYLEAYPGVPEDIVAKDKDYTFEDNSVSIEQTKGTFDDILVDATNGKFAVQPEYSRVQINSGTILYIPVTTDEQGVSILISGVDNQSQAAEIQINGDNYYTNQKISLDIHETSYIKVQFSQQTYVGLISIDYESDLGFEVPDVKAIDTGWDFTSNAANTRPEIQGGKDEYEGIQIDASSGKFSPRDGDTQINATTILYIPLAKDDEIAVSVNGNNYNGLKVTWDNQDITIGKEFVIANEETRYVPLKFEGEGSCYLENIRIDYKSDNQSISHTVRVGSSQEADYQTIQSALDHEISDAAHPLIIDIEPGVYEEKLEISQSHVTLRALSSQPEDVVIKSGFYSSNTFINGEFKPQDDYDVGTDKSGTIIVTSGASAFSMYNITVENNYNTEKKTQKDEQTPAVAFCSNADKVYLNNCRLIGRQDTLYVKGNGNRTYFKDCYIEGTVDFIFGDADAYFEACQLHMAYFNGKKNGYFTAPNTKKDGVGLVFYQCSLSADERVEDVSLGRPWQNECYTVTETTADGVTYVVDYDPSTPNPLYADVSSATQFIDCTMSHQIQNERWNKWIRKNKDGETISVTYEETVRFIEYNSHDEQGNLLNTDDFDVVLGKMAYVDDLDSYLSDTLTLMRIGNGLGLWLPNLDTYHPSEPVTPIEPVEPVIPEKPDVSEEPQIPKESWQTNLGDDHDSQLEESFESLKTPHIQLDISSHKVVPNVSLLVTGTDETYKVEKNDNQSDEVVETIGEKDIPLASSSDNSSPASHTIEAKTQNQPIIYIVCALVGIGIIGLVIFLRKNKKIS